MSAKTGRVEVKKAFNRLKSINNGEQQKLHKWSGRLKEKWLPDIEAVHIKGFGLVGLPLEVNDILKLAKKYSSDKIQTSQETIEKMACQIDSSEITFIPKRHANTTPQQMLQVLTSNVLQSMLGVTLEDLNFSIEAQLQKLVVCLTGDSYQSAIAVQSQPGKFGLLLVQIPIAVDQACGSAIIYDGVKETSVQFHSNRSYSAAAVAGSCSSETKAGFSIRSGSGEVTAVLIFSLVWNDFMRFHHLLPATYLPDILVAANSAKTGLMPGLSYEGGSSEDPRFLCAPAIHLNDRITETSISNISETGLLKYEILRSISFLDVHIVNIECEKNVDGKAASSSEHNTNTQKLLRFKEVVLTHTKIEDDILEHPINVDEHFIEDFSSYGFTEGATKQETIPVVLFRAKNPQLMLIHESNRQEKFIPDILLKTLEKRLTAYSFRTVKESKHLRMIFLKDLEQIVDLLNTEKPSKCLSCFFSPLFHVCVQLNADKLSLKLLSDVVKHHDSVDDWLLCGYGCCPNGLDPIAAFSSFIYFTRGWERCPDDLKQLMGQMLSEKSFHIIAHVGLHLLNNDDLHGSQETFNFALQALRAMSSNPSRIKEIFHVRLVVLAIRLHEEQQQPIDELLAFMKHLDPRQLAEVVKHLAQHLKDKTLNCEVFLKSLGNLINETCFYGFTSKEFRKITRIYSSVEGKFVKLFWKSLCSQCIQVSQSEQERTCLLCGILEEDKSANVRNEMIDRLESVKEVKEALKCSLQKLRVKHETFDVNKLTEFIHCIISMENIAQLTQDEIVENISALFSNLPSKDLLSLSNHLTKNKLNLICDKFSTMRRIAESLLIQISKQDTNAIFSSTSESVLENFAWFGDVKLVKTVVIDKLNESIANSTVKLSEKLAIVLGALKSTEKETGCNAASSLLFNRQVFNYLMLECLKALENLTERTSDCVECFHLLATSEKSFIDSTEPAVTAKWLALSGSLTFFEIVEVAKGIFGNEIFNEGPSLKKFPSCWQVFTELSNNVISKWDLNVVKEKLAACHVVYLMQIFFWIGEEKGIVEFQRLINEIPRAIEHFQDVHSSIIRDAMTFKLATSSSHGLLALSDLIDARYETLSRRLAYILTEDTVCSLWRRGSSYTQQNRVNVSASVMCNFSYNSTNCTVTAKRYTDQLEAEHRWTDNTSMQMEIEELKALRKKLLMTILQKESNGL